MDLINRTFQLLAASPVDLGTISGIGPLNPNNVSDKDSVRDQFNNAISTFISVLTVVAGLVFLFQLFLGAFVWLTAGGDANKVTNAQKQISNAVIGLVVSVAAYMLTALVAGLLGLEIFNPLGILE